MWEEAFICTLIFTGIFFIIPSIIRKRYFYIIVIIGLSLYLSSIMFIKSLRLKEHFDTSSGGYITREGGAGNPVFVCGTSGKACDADTPYCSITERELPANTVDQNVVFNTYARYVSIYPPATSGDGVVSISQIAIYDETGTNIALNKTPTGNCDTTTTTPSGQLARTVNGTMKPQKWPNLFSTAVTDRNAPSWSIDLGSKRMITSVRYIGRGDYGMKTGENPRNKGIRVRLYINTTDTPTTGTCTATPDIIYPASITEAEKSIIAPLILKGYDGNKALNIYNKVNRNPPQDFSQYLTDAQAAKSYSNIYLKNLLTRKFGWKVKARWDVGSNIITVLSGSMPANGMTIASSGNDGSGAVDESGLPVQSFPVGTRVTAVSGNIVTLDNLSTGSGTNTEIKFDATITDQEYNAQTFKFKNINSMSNWPSTVDKNQALIDFKSYNKKTGTTIQKNPDGTAKYTLDASGVQIFTPVQYTDDGTAAALTIIMNTTLTPVQDSAAGISALTDGGEGASSGYLVKNPPNTFDWGTASNSAVPSEGYDARAAVFDTNNEVTLIGVNTFDTNAQSSTSLVAAQSAQISAGSGNDAYAQDFASIAKRTQLKEVFVLGDSNTFSNLSDAKVACQAIGADIADYAALSDMITKLSTIFNTPATGTTFTPSSNSGTSAQYQKRPQWHEYGFCSDGTKAFPTQQATISQLPGGQSGTYTSASPTSKTNRGGVVTANRSKAGAVCYGIKPSITPSTRTFDSKYLSIPNQNGRYVRIWASSDIAYFQLSFGMDIVVNSDSTTGTESIQSVVTINDNNGTTYEAYMNRSSKRVYWEYDLGSQMSVSTIQLSIYSPPSNFSNNYTVEVAKAPRPQPFFQGYDDKDKKNFLWNDKSAFSPPCPTGLSDMICTSPETGLQDLLCLPALPDENTSYSPGGTKPTYADAVATKIGIGIMDPGVGITGALYGLCGSFMTNAPNSSLPLRQTKCPMDCDPGAVYDTTSGQCKYRLSRCDAWISMALLELDYTSYVSGTSFDGSRFAGDYNKKIFAGNKAYHQYKATELPGTVPKDCPPGKEYSAGLCYDPCGQGYFSDGAITCWRRDTNVGAGVAKLPIDCPTDPGWVSYLLTCQLDLHCTGGGCHGGACRTWCAGGRDALGNCWAWDLKTECDPIYCDPIVCNDGPKTWGRYNADNHRCPDHHPDYVDGLCYPSCPAGQIHVAGAPYNCTDPNARWLSYTRAVGTMPFCGATRPRNVLGLCYLPED